MPRHEGKFETEPHLLRAMNAAPFPYHLLRDRDFFDMNAIDTESEPEIWRMPRGGALVRIWHDGYWATRAEVLTENKALDLYLKVGAVLPSATRDAVERAVAGRPTPDDAIAAIKRERVSVYPNPRMGAKQLMSLITHDPRREVLLEVTLEDGRIASHTLFEGKPYWTRLRKYFRTRQSQPAKTT